MNRHARKDARTLEADLLRLQAGVEGAAGQVDRMLRDAISAAPLVTVGAFAGLGFLIGGGLPRGALTVFLGVGARMAGTWLQHEFLERPDTQE